MTGSNSPSVWRGDFSSLVLRGRRTNLIVRGVNVILCRYVVCSGAGPQFGEGGKSFSMVSLLRSGGDDWNWPE